MKATTRTGLVLILVGLVVVMSLPGLTGADGGGANVVRGDDCTISLVELGGTDVTTTDTQSVETPSGNVSLVCRAELPDELEPPRRAMRTRGELCETSLGPTKDTEKVITPAGRVRLTCRVNGRARPPATGWAAGDTVDGYGVIIHTTDGGQTWVRQGTAGEIPDVDLGGVAAIDAQNAWVVGDHGVILRTRNAGRTWERQEVPSEVSDVRLNGVYAVDRKNAWATGESGVLLHTTDGGQTWTRQGQGTVPPQAELIGVYASDADHAWAISSFPALVLRTTNGGAGWQTVPYTCEECGYPIWVHGVDASTVWVAGNRMVMHTPDGGLNWVVQTPPGWGDFNAVFAVDGSTIWTVLDPAGIYRSDDGGATWETQPYPVDGRYTRISAVDKQRAWIVTVPRYASEHGDVLHTADGGQTWNIQTTPVRTEWWGVSFVR
jgi:photosystem II stability/assembly factor-like uncharacterized protein